MVTVWAQKRSALNLLDYLCKQLGARPIASPCQFKSQRALVVGRERLGAGALIHHRNVGVFGGGRSIACVGARRCFFRVCASRSTKDCTRLSPNTNGSRYLTRCLKDSGTAAREASFPSCM